MKAILAILGALLLALPADAQTKRTCLFGNRTDPAVLELIRQQGAANVALIQGQSAANVALIGLQSRQQVCPPVSSAPVQPIQAPAPQIYYIQMPAQQIQQPIQQVAPPVQQPVAPPNTLTPVMPPNVINPPVYLYNLPQVISPGIAPGQVIQPGQAPAQVIQPGQTPAQVIAPGVQPGQVITPGVQPGQIIAPNAGQQPGQVITPNQNQGMSPALPGQVITPNQPGQQITPGTGAPPPPVGFQRYIATKQVLVQGKWYPAGTVFARK